MESEHFRKLPFQYEDPILGLVAKFKADPRKNKLNLTLGVVPGAEFGRVWRPLCINEFISNNAEQITCQSYLPILGYEGFRHAILRHLNEYNLCIQSLGSTGALYLIFKLCSEFFGVETLVVQTPCWPNYSQLAVQSHIRAEIVPYFNNQLERDFSTFLDEISRHLNQGKHVVGVLQLACHNPTGIDISLEELKFISDFFAKNFPRALLVIDHAYDGFVPFDEIKERLKVLNTPHFLCYSCSKNFGLYSLRTGALCVKFPEKGVLSRIEAALKMIIRGTYSTPPSLGCEAVTWVLSDDERTKLWKSELSDLRDRIQSIRESFAGNFPEPLRTFILNQRGMFVVLPTSFTIGYSAQYLQQEIIEKHAIYTVALGDEFLRINLTAIQNTYQAITISDIINQFF